MDETNFEDLICYFKGDSSSKKFDDFKNGIRLFEKVKPSAIKLEETKKYQNVFKLNLNDIKRERFKSEEQKGAFKNIGKPYKAQKK